ncbi:YbbL ABC transporter ATP-binding protein [Streptococcus acidominimus]|uniref:YbbL ABC transporter ATP-binding protein n=1 Tax=Streptococcus acidominimus TaxID=1326 RepID=A0A239X5F3_STRAI|nr:YbbL ABC transporter ATP-binding protein [Streptococcus acidominimus]
MSGGEKQRVALIRNLLFEPEALLLDEVTAGLDAKTKAIVHQLIDNYRKSGKTVIKVTHDQSEIDAAERLITIEEGKLINDKCLR